MSSYPFPAQEARAEILVLNSRFIASVTPAHSVDAARDFLRQIKAEFPVANHHVPAFVIGHGASVITHCHDDGEPSGTAGRPALAVLQGSGVGDAAVVVTRFFGGTKLGTGGLVRAYGDAVRSVLAGLQLAVWVPTHTVLMAIPYPLYEQSRRLAQAHGGEIVDEEFTADVTVTARFTVVAYPAFETALRDLSRGSVQPEIVETGEMIKPTGRLPN